VCPLLGGDEEDAGDTLPATLGGVMERCLAGVLVLLFTGEGDAVRDGTGEVRGAVATLCVG
jgi:hypothetical protein